MDHIYVGDFVKINGQENIAQVLAVKGNDLEVAMGSMKMMVKKNKVILVEAPVVFADAPIIRDITSGVDIKEKLLNFKFELDVRGKMKDEVMTELAPWADDAILLGIPEARIVHGRGSGIIKETVRSVLKKYKEVESVRDAEQHHGGDFVTIVTFKK